MSTPSSARSPSSSFPLHSPAIAPEGQTEHAAQYRDLRDFTVLADHRTDAPLRTSSLAYQTFINSQRRMRKVQPQYTASAEMPHVEFILVASFNIASGSIMEHQYPGIISGDEHMLADLMLPDQMHNRSQDWTVFFLHKEPNPEDEGGEQSGRRKRRKQRRDKVDSPVDPDGPFAWGESTSTPNGEHASSDDEDEDEDEIEEAPLIYVLNLVNTKYDSKVER